MKKHVESYQQLVKASNKSTLLFFVQLLWEGRPPALRQRMWILPHTEISNTAVPASYHPRCGQKLSMNTFNVVCSRRLISLISALFISYRLKHKIVETWELYRMKRVWWLGMSGSQELKKRSWKTQESKNKGKITYSVCCFDAKHGFLFQNYIWTTDQQEHNLSF